MAIDAVKIKFALEGVADVTKAFSLIEDRMAKAENAGTESAKRGAAARVSQTQKEVADREKAYAKLASQVEREEKEGTRATERERQRREAIVRRSSEMAGRYAAEQANAEIREAQRATQALERENEKRARSHRALGQSMGRSVLRGVSGVGAMAAGALSMGGGFMLADVAREELSVGRTAAQLVNVVTTGKKPPPGATVANIMGQASQVATETGMNKADLVGAALSYAQHAKGGDFAGAMGNMGFFAKMSQVTGASIGDIAMSAGTLQSQNAELGTKQMQQMLLDVYAQGKQGSMSMVDVAKQMGTLGSQRASFTGDVTKNQRELMGLGQIVAPGGDIAEAGTFTKDMAQEAIKKHKKLAALGVKYDSSGRIDMSPTEMVAQVFKGTKGNLGTINDIFEGRGGKVFGELEGAYQKAGGGAKGVDAVRAQMSAVTSATMTTGQLEEQHAQTMEQPIEKLSVAFEKLKESVADQLTPWIDKFTAKLPAITDTLATVGVALGTFAELIVNNPVPAALAAFALKMGGSAGMIAEAFIAGIALIDWAAAADRAMQRKNVSQDLSGLTEASQLSGKVRDKTVTAADIQKANADAEALRAQANAPQNGGSAAIGKMAPGVGGIVGAIMGTSDRDAQDAKSRKNAADAADMLTKAAKQAAVALAAMAASAKDPARSVPTGTGTR